MNPMVSKISKFRYRVKRCLYNIVKTLQLQSRYQIGPGIYTCRQAMKYHSQWKPISQFIRTIYFTKTKSQLFIWSLLNAILCIVPLFTYHNHLDHIHKWILKNPYSNTLTHKIMTVKTERGSYFLPRNWPIRASQRPHLCNVTPLYFELPLENPVLWRRRICTNSSFVKLLICVTVKFNPRTK